MVTRWPEHASWRLLTIAFIDLVGSTPLSLVLDGDDYDEVIANYWGAVIPVIEKHGGFAAGEEGDGRLVWFGWPQVTASDAERAVTMALDVRQTVRKLATGYRDRLGIDLAVRLGVHTGEIIVRATPGQPPNVVGAAANVAAKVQSATTPDTVCISATTANLIGDHYVLRPSGSLTIDGLRGELDLFQVDEEQPTGVDLHDHVGRHEELETLGRLWGEVGDGKSGAVLIVGEAGIGKSRLARTLVDRRVETEPVLTIQGDSYRQDESLGALAGGLMRSAMIEANSLATQLPSAPERDEFMGALVATLEIGVAERPGVVLVEDAQWLDHSTAEFVSRLIRAEVPGLLVIATSRLTATAMEPIGSVRTVTLRPLETDGLDAIVRAHAPSLDDPTVHEVVERACGNPLFAEVLAVAAAETVDPDRHPAMLPHSKVPIVVQQALRIHLEASQSAADVSSTAAAIGIEFTADLVRAAHPAHVDVDAELRWLRSTGVISEVQPEGTYRFRHALVHQLAYDLLVRSSRKLRHGRIGDALKEIGKVGPTVLGMHYERAGRSEEAAESKIQAAVEARASGAFREGVDLIDQALDLLEHDVTTERRDLEVRALDLRAGLTAAFDRFGYLAGELDRDRLAVLLEVDSDDVALMRALTRQWAGAIVMSDLRGAGGAVRRMRGPAANDSISHVLTHVFRGTNTMYRGNYAYAEPLLGKAALKLAELGLQPEFRANWSTADDPVSVALSRMPPLLWVRGKHEEAESMLKLAETEAASVQGPAVAMSFAHVKANSAMFSELIGDGERAIGLGQEIVEIGREPELAFWQQIGGLHQLIGSVMVEPKIGQVDSLLDAARQLESSARLFAPMVYLLAAQGYLKLGSHEKALESTDGARSIAEETGARWLWSETLRLRSHALANEQSGLPLLVEASQVAHRQGARIYEARALIDLLAGACGTVPDEARFLEQGEALLAGFPTTSTLPEIEELAGLLR